VGHFSSEEEGPLVERLSCHLPWILKRLRIYPCPVLGQQDFEAAGRLGALRAIRSYDPEKGNSLDDYAIWAMKGEILDMVRKVRKTRQQADAPKFYSMEHGQGLAAKYVSDPHQGPMDEAARREIWEHVEQILERDSPAGHGKKDPRYLMIAKQRLAEEVPYKALKRRLRCGVDMVHYLRVRLLKVLRRSRRLRRHWRDL
jgi:hypothetical protein